MISLIIDLNTELVQHIIYLISTNRSCFTTGLDAGTQFKYKVALNLNH